MCQKGQGWDALDPFSTGPDPVVPDVPGDGVDASDASATSTPDVPAAESDAQAAPDENSEPDPRLGGLDSLDGSNVTNTADFLTALGALVGEALDGLEPSANAAETDDEQAKAARKWAEEHPWEASVLVAKGLWEAVCQAAASTGKTITDILAALGGVVGIVGTGTPGSLQPTPEQARWARDNNLNINSETSRQLAVNNDMTVQDFLAKFRQGSIKS